MNMKGCLGIPLPGSELQPWPYYNLMIVVGLRHFAMYLLALQIDLVKFWAHSDLKILFLSLRRPI